MLPKTAHNSVQRLDMTDLTAVQTSFVCKSSDQEPSQHRLMRAVSVATCSPEVGSVGSA